jgi:hypothetical protein
MEEIPMPPEENTRNRAADPQDKTRDGRKPQGSAPKAHDGPVDESDDGPATAPDDIGE